MKFYIFPIFIFLFFAGCSSKYELFQEKERHTVDETGSAKDSSLLETVFPKKQKAIIPRTTQNEEKLNFQFSSKIIPSDTLKIDIYNRSKRISLQDIGEETKQATEDYMVDIDGMVYLPLLGVVTLKGLDERAASRLLTEKYKEYLNEPYVKVQLLSTRVYVLGEVGSPGMLPVSASGVSIYEVLAKSGDLGEDAQRDSIKIISGELGKQTMRTIDMTKMSVLNSTNLMIRPNSIIYVEPRYMKSVKIAINDVTPILGFASTLLGTYLSIDYLTNGND